MRKRLPVLILATLGAAAFLLTPVAAEELTIERIFAAPDLSGNRPRRVKISPDGKRVTFLRGKPSDPDRLDLWEYNVEAGETRLLVDSDRLVDRAVELSDEEKARRERQRIGGLSGIVEYSWSPRGDALLFPLGGDVYLYDLGKPPARAVRRITGTAEFETDARFSPGGNQVSYVREQDLYIHDLGAGRERRLTSDGGGVISNGMAEFIAQEEMRRFTGYWWSPDERRIAFTRVDESPVPIADRFEIQAESIDVYHQRYPWAGSPNAEIRLLVIDLETGKITEMDLGGDQDIYLYRVAWFPDSRHLAVSRQPRDLQSLDLIRYDVRRGKPRLLLRETSDTWIELQDILVFLESRPEFLWSSDRDGYQHLYLYDRDGNLIRQVTDGEWVVLSGSRGKSVIRVDEKARRVFFTATRESPLEVHLYSQSLDTRTPDEVTRITRRTGVHRITMEGGAGIYVDVYSNPGQPPQVSVHDLAGEHLAWLEENALEPGHPYHPFAGKHILPEFGTITASDGQKLYYRLLKPAGFDPSRRYPVVIYVYGGPQGQDIQKSWGGRFAMWLQFLARRGYAVFTVDNRGTGFRGRAFDAPIYMRLGHVEVRDQLAGVKFLKQQSWVDPERIGLFGWSYGGYMSLMMLLQSPGTFAAGVAGAPVTDWRLYDTYYTERFLGRPDANPDGYENSSVFPFIGNLEDHLLVIHGMADDNVLFTNSTKLFKALQDAGKQFEVMVYPGAKHSLVGVEKTGPHSLEAATRFLDRNLKP